MNSSRDDFFNALFDAAKEQLSSLGGIAWTIGGVLLLCAILAMAVALRWIWSGGLARSSVLWRIR